MCLILVTFFAIFTCILHLQLGLEEIERALNQRHRGASPHTTEENISEVQRGSFFTSLHAIQGTLRSAVAEEHHGVDEADTKKGRAHSFVKARKLNYRMKYININSGGENKKELIKF